MKNRGYEVSLEKRQIYLALPDEAADKQGLLRIVDESGDDYPYPRKFFSALDLPPTLKRSVMAAE